MSEYVSSGAGSPFQLADDDEKVLRVALERVADTLLEVSHSIHAHPEIRFEERFACDLLAETLIREGFEVETGVAGMPTAFLGVYEQGQGGPAVAFFCEYDALEQIGHGCGHNTIAAAGLGAAVLAAEWVRAHPAMCARLVVVGSPGEEGGGGKAFLVDSGRLAGIDAAMMVHPDSYTAAAVTTFARVTFDMGFVGKAAHAAVSPERGRNALDAAVLTLTAIGLLRQQLPSDVRVQAIVREGGEAPNIIPEKASIRASVRAPDTHYLLNDVLPRVENCARGAALATGTEVRFTTDSPPYAALKPNSVLAALVEGNLRRVGREPDPARTGAFPGSTDMGNVSEVIPSIHPVIQLSPDIGMHSHEAAALAVGSEGDRVVLDGALVLAMTAAQLVTWPSLIGKVKAALTSSA